MYFGILQLETEMYCKINVYIDNISDYIQHEQVKRLLQSMYNKIYTLKTNMIESEIKAVTDEEKSIVNVLVYELTQSHKLLFPYLHSYMQSTVEEMINMVF
jgi:hypothetical protein